MSGSSDAPGGFGSGLRTGGGGSGFFAPAGEAGVVGAAVPFAAPFAGADPPISPDRTDDEKLDRPPALEPFAVGAADGALPLPFGAEPAVPVVGTSSGCGAKSVDADSKSVASVEFEGGATSSEESVASEVREAVFGEVTTNNDWRCFFSKKFCCGEREVFALSLPALDDLEAAVVFAAAAAVTRADDIAAVAAGVGWAAFGVAAVGVVALGCCWYE